MKRYLSGITPSSGKGLHLGNYLGAVKQHVEAQDNGEGFYFVANYHALNLVHDPRVFKENWKNVYLDYLSFGIDPTKSTFFLETDIPEICELQTILNNVVPLGVMKRMHAFKDKLQKGEDTENINMGLFVYGILMAADILIFDAEIVPVGKDQTQHVELARNIAGWFNNRYGEVLVVPQLQIAKDFASLVGTDGVRKMSKSLGNDISIFADEKVIHKQIFSTITDTNRIHKDDPGDPEKNPIFSYMKLLNFDLNRRLEMENRYKDGTIGDVEIKKEFFDFFLDTFRPFREKRIEFEKAPDYIIEIRKKAQEHAVPIARETLHRVRSAVGI